MATFADMRLKVGDLLPLEARQPFAGGVATVQLLGWMERASVLVTLPRNAAGLVPLDVGDQVTIRAFTGKSAFAFRTTVLRVAYQPFGYAHLRFPEQSDAVLIRSSFRHRLSLPASVRQGEGAPASAIIRNIGTSGALVETALPLSNPGAMLTVSTDFELHGVPVHLDLKAAVRSTREVSDDAGAPAHQSGVEFQDLAPNDRLILGSLLWYEMHEHPAESV